VGGIVDRDRAIAADLKRVVSGLVVYELHHEPRRRTEMPIHHYAAILSNKMSLSGSPLESCAIARSAPNQGSLYVNRHESTVTVSQII
jgi:hypothetical protein